MKSTKDTTEDSKLNKEKVESDRNKVKTRRTLIQLLYVYAILDYLNDIILCYFFFFYTDVPDTHITRAQKALVLLYHNFISA